MASTQKLPNKLEGKALHMRDSNIEAPKIDYAKEMHVEAPKIFFNVKIILFLTLNFEFGFNVEGFKRFD